MSYRFYRRCRWVSPARVVTTSCALRARLRPTRPAPVRPQSLWRPPSALGEPSLAAFEHLLGDESRGHRRRPAGVECEMGNDLAQFAFFEPVVERALQVADQLLL